MNQNYYEILGMDKKATPEEIKKTYRKLMLKHSPDKIMQQRKQQQKCKKNSCGAGSAGDRFCSEECKKICEEATERVKEFNEAYETLSDPQKRKNYDQKLDPNSSSNSSRSSNSRSTQAKPTTREEEEWDCDQCKKKFKVKGADLKNWKYKESKYNSQQGKRVNFEFCSKKCKEDFLKSSSPNQTKPRNNSNKEKKEKLEAKAAECKAKIHKKAQEIIDKSNTISNHH